MALGEAVGWRQRPAPRPSLARKNVRELENTLERALIVAGQSEIRPDHLAIGAGAGPGTRSPDLLREGFELDAHERELVFAAMDRAGGNKTNAAKLLGITRRRLYTLLVSYGGGPATADE